MEFTQLFDATEGRMGVTVTFLSLLELLKESLIELVQAEPYAPIHVRAAGNVKAVPDAGIEALGDEPEIGSGSAAVDHVEFAATEQADMDHEDIASDDVGDAH